MSKKKLRGVLVLSPKTMPGILAYAQRLKGAVDAARPETLEEGILGWLVLAIWAAKFAGLDRGDLLGAAGIIFDETALNPPGETQGH